MKKLNLTTALCLLIITIAPAFALAQTETTLPPPIFGPARYEINAPPQQLFTDHFGVGYAGLYLVTVANGDVQTGDSRVTSGTLILQGHLVFPPGEINPTVDRLERRIFLDSGPTRIAAILNGNAGDFIKVAVIPLPMPDLRAGKLTLDFGSRFGDNHLVLFLHNNNFAHERGIRLIFNDMRGRPAGISHLLTIPPSGTLALNPDTVPAPQPIIWQHGSIDAIWMGRGAIPVTGYAAQVDRAGNKTTVKLNNFRLPIIPDDIE